MATYEKIRDNEIVYAEVIPSKGCEAHFHSAIEILIMESGSAKVICNGVNTVLTKGSILISNSYDVHTYIVPQDSIAKVIIIPKSLLRQYFSTVKNRKFKTNIISIPQCFEQIMDILRIMEYYSDIKPRNYYIINSLAQSAFAVLTGYLTLSDNVIDKDNMTDILHYIYENFCEDITLKSISKKFGYSPNHFSHIFNSYMGINLAGFINNLRLEKSVELIKNNSTITNAAENSGFQSLRTFYRCFKKKYNFSPKQIKDKLL